MEINDVNKESAVRCTFRKSGRLRLRTLVEGLFAEGNTLYEYPLRVTWRKLDAAQLQEAFRHGVPEGIGPLQVLITVPKRKLRHAVDRVKMRRRIREAWRLNRHPLEEAAATDPSLRTLCVAIVYMHAGLLPYADVEKKVRKVVRRLAAKLNDKPLPEGTAPDTDSKL